MANFLQILIFFFMLRERNPITVYQYSFTHNKNKSRRIGFLLLLLILFANVLPRTSRRPLSLLRRYLILAISHIRTEDAMAAFRDSVFSSMGI